MLVKFRKNTFIIVILLLLGWLFYIIYKNSDVERLYSQHEFNDDMGKIHQELGLLAQDRGDIPAAITFLQNALPCRPLDLALYDQLAICYEKSASLEDAFALYLKATYLNPHFVDQRQLGERGVEEREVPMLVPAKAALWQGEALGGKSIYLYDQDDNAQSMLFARFLSHVVKRGATVYFKPEKSLYRLFKQSFPEIHILHQDDDVSSLNVDYLAALSDVPYHLHVELSEIAPTPYLHVGPQRVEAQAVSKKYGNIGICWQNDTNKGLMSDRSVPLSFFYDLGLINKIKLHALHSGNLESLPEGVKIAPFTGEKDWLDVAGLITACDLIITVDGPVAHLAGALGKPTWILLPSVASWYWFTAVPGQHVPWYKNTTLFQQDAALGWHPIFELIKQEIEIKMPRR